MKNVINKTNLVSVFDEYQPVAPEVNRAEMDKEFPILKDCIFSSRPDWNYSLDTIKHYLNAFKNVYNDMADDELSDTTRRTTLICLKICVSSTMYETKANISRPATAHSFPQHVCWSGSFLAVHSSTP